MTPERSRHMNAQIKRAREDAAYKNQGLLVTIFDCGGYSTRADADLIPGSKTEQHVPCSHHYAHAFTDTPAHHDPATTTDNVARIISNAADKYRGIARDYSQPTPQDWEAAEQVAETYYLVPRAEFPAVPDNAISQSAVTVGTYCFSGAQDRTPASIRRDIASLAAWADYLERKQAEQAAKEAETEARRQALYQELSDGTHIAPEHKAMVRAIDRIIDLEDAQP